MINLYLNDKNVLRFPYKMVLNDDSDNAASFFPSIVTFPVIN